MDTRPSFRSQFRVTPRAAFSRTDLLVTIALLTVLAAVAFAALSRSRAKSSRAQCESNLGQVNRAMLQYAREHPQTFPSMEGSPVPGGWWWYKELIKGHLGLRGESSAGDLVFGCPDDRGYGDGTEEATPFRRSAKHDFTSYVFNGVNLPGVPNIAGRTVGSIREPVRTLLTMEWTAHAPLSWHRSRTGRANTPFYTDAESVVGFVDGHVAMTKIYYDGLNAAYTRDPAPGYTYKYSGN